MVTVLEITYSNNKIKKVCTDDNIATKVYGPAMARKIHQRIIELSASDTIE